MNNSWQFFIDVGGTFTDCIAVTPSKKTRQIKVLSSGQIKGVIGSDSTNKMMVDSSRSEQPGFWDGVELHWLNQVGDVVSKSRVARFEEGQFELAAPVNDWTLEQAVGYEIRSGLAAPILGIHLLMELPVNESIPDCKVQLGTTRGTNALLTRGGPSTALVTTKGFRDLLTIGDQSRPDLFALVVSRQRPLCQFALELDERILADGTVEQSLNEETAEQQLKSLMNQGVHSLAVCLMHAWKNPLHEKQIGDIARKLGFPEVRLSHELVPLMRILHRAETTVLDAYINPVLRDYIDEIKTSLSAGSRLHLMTSSGGLVDRANFSGRDSLLSGPAGGVVGAARVAQQVGFDKMIGFDMGGTSTDVSRFDGEFQIEYESRKAGVRVLAPVMAIETVAAGGGSICRFDGARMLVGPQSAGNDPGPACYGKGGPLTITDVNLFLGRFDESQFPFPLDHQASASRLNEIATQLNQQGIGKSAAEVAEGFLEIANNNMALAIRNVSIAKGVDPTGYLMVSFGGAGSQHSCAVAEILGIRKVLVHPRSSLLSAEGIRLADFTSDRVSPVDQLLNDASITKCHRLLMGLEQAATRQLIDAGREASTITVSRSLDLRYRGTEPFESIAWPEDGDFESAFSKRHQKLYGYTHPKPIEIVAARCHCRSRGWALPDSKPMDAPFSIVAPEQFRIAWVNGQQTEVAFFRRDHLTAGQQVAGPALISDSTTSIVLEPNWSASMLADGQLLLEFCEQKESGQVAATESQIDPVQLEVFNQNFVSIATQMGSVLQRTSSSVNVKERLDFSCALFTATGDLVVNAPHIPVHLGAMSETVRETIRLNPDIQAGDVIVTNDPYAGGSHLPDVTVVSPVYDQSKSKLMFWVASRGHHAELGGKAPGSMPADATCLQDEGVLIQNFRLLRASENNFDQFRSLLTSGPWPSRLPDENIADLNAQLAANRCGEELLIELVDQHGFDRVETYMRAIQETASVAVAEALAKIDDGQYTFKDQMDNGRIIRLSITKQDDSILFDFEGTDAVSPDNLNANRAIVSAAVMYVLRCLCDADLPLNEGIMKEVQINLPNCFLNAQAGESPEFSPAIVGGNVETSQRIVDAIIGALGIAAASQGTMNNWLMGDDNFGYYETVGGGSGATREANGEGGVHVHMTNTRLTDPEVLESRFPVIVRESLIRTGSGGLGKHRGGDGMVRSIEFCKPLTISLLTSRRSCHPFGADGGQPGATGENLLQRANGSSESLPSQCQVQVNAGDRLVLKTPGGGGFGDVPE